jgi:hypothetical protein
MHNCRETKEQITELLLDGFDRRPNEVLAEAIRACPECRSEFDALRSILRVTTRLRETAAPAESYWSGYHFRLRQKIANLAEESHAKAQRREGEPRSFFAPLRLCVKTTVPIPLPLMILAALALFAILATRQATIPSPVIVHVPVEVPVVQEKIVTRVVYRDKRIFVRSSTRVIDSPKTDSTLARSQKPPQNTELPPSLTGFKPTDEVKLTVIKGGSQNEK